MNSLGNIPNVYSESYNVCDDCGLFCEDLRLYYVHRKEHLMFSDYKTFTGNSEKHDFRNRHFLCRYCEKTCSNLFNLASHERKHEQGPPKINWKIRKMVKIDLFDDCYERSPHIFCKYCRQKCNSAWELTRHKWKSHKNIITDTEKPFICELCGMSFYTQINLDLHKRRKCPHSTSQNKDGVLTRHSYNNTKISPKIYNCEYCNKNFTSLWYMQRHKKIHKANMAKHCNFCTGKFTDNNKLELHVKRCHPHLIKQNCVSAEKYKVLNKKSFKCDVCYKVFLVQENYIRHLETKCQKLELVECDLCPRKFINTRGLQRHRILHSGGSLFECSICFKKYLSLPNLWVHQEQEHGKKNVNNSEEHQKDDIKDDQIKDRPYYAFKCDFCTQYFAKLSSLRNHEKVHTADTPYFCNICGKKFSTSSDRSRHMKGVHKVKFNHKYDFDQKEEENSDSSERDIKIAQDENEFENLHLSENVLNNEENQENTLSEFEDSIEQGGNNCEICSIKFSSVKALRTHTIQIHLLKCNICKSTCESILVQSVLKYLNQGMPNSVTVIDPTKNQRFELQKLGEKFTCNNCETKFDLLQLLNSTSKKDYPFYTCNSCSGVILEGVFESHTINVGSFTCRKCFMESLNQSNSQGTGEEKQTETGLYSCSMCDFKFTTLKLLYSHKNKDHCYDSDMSDAAGTSPIELSEDESLETYFCDMCSYKTKELELLYLHKKDRHPWFVCKVCNELFSKEEDLKQHAIIHKHKNWQNGKRLVLEENIYGKELEESEDKSIFTTFTVLHSREEEKGTWYSCKFCGKEYLLLSELMIHSVIHQRPGIFKNSYKICNL